MSTLKDLRELINVSRLTYREDSDHDNDEEEVNYNHESFNQYQKKTKLNDDLIKSPPVNKIKGSSSSSAVLSPIKSKSNPIDKINGTAKAIRNSYVLSSYIENPTSSLVLDTRASLLDRKSIPVTQINNKKPLPPLGGAGASSDDPDPQDEDEQKQETNDKIINGNFDHILTYIDASVVSDWLNRSNKYLKKMFKWHSKSTSELNNIFSQDYYKNLLHKDLKYEGFIHFCNFWLGHSEKIKFSEKQRRGLIKMEYSIICDEIIQAFHAGLESQQVNLNEINQLMRAVYKEYPLQMLSFRGGYLILDILDILSSDRDEDYKRLLSDVKCRTVNKQYAQWLLSIRSFSLISMCWSIVKFYKQALNQHLDYLKTVNENINQQNNSKADNNNNNSKLMTELDGRVSSLSIQNIKSKNEYESLSSRSDDDERNGNESSISSSRTSSSSHKSTTSSSLKKNKPKERPSIDSVENILPNSVKYDLYVDACLK
jgi:hypothetical protein